MAATPERLCVFMDADVLFAGSASPSEQGASLALLRLGEIGLLQVIVSEQVIAETERNLTQKIPTALPLFRLLTSRALQVRPNPTAADLLPLAGCANPKDLPILAAALCENCAWLVTFNGRHFLPGHPQITVLKPGDFIQRIRYLLTTLH